MQRERARLVEEGKRLFLEALEKLEGNPVGGGDL